MPHYFKPLRRKIGVTTLLMACMLTAGWVRSLFVHDVLLFIGENEPLGLWGSQSGSLRRSTFGLDAQRRSILWQNWIASEGVHPFDDPNIKWQWRCCGFGVGDDGMERIVPYWSIVIPLTLLSCWLLLSKPKQRKPFLEQQTNA